MYLYASKTRRWRYTSSGGVRRHLSRCGSVRRGSWFPPGTNSIPRPCFAALKGKAHCRILISDRDFTTASPPITSFSFSEKEKEGKRKTAQGVPPRSEIHYVAAGRGGDTMNSMRLHPPRLPEERASWEREPTEILCTAEKVSVFGANRVCSASRAALRGEGWSYA